jgi:ribonuclease HI
MKVSIFTDASVRFKWCGDAFYIGCRIGKIQKAGRLKVRTNKTDLAELHCIANAVYTLKHSKFTPIDKVFIYCDSASSVNVLNGLARFVDEEKRKVVDEIHFLMIEVCVKHGKTMRDLDTFFEVSHIKAHTGKDDIFSKINDWCDKNAKLYSKPILANPQKKTKKKSA